MRVVHRIINYCTTATLKTGVAYYTWVRITFEILRGMLLLYFSEFRVHVTDSLSDADQINRSLSGVGDKSQHGFSAVSIHFF